MKKSIVGVLVLGEDLGGFCMVIPQVGDGGARSASRNFRFGSRITGGTNIMVDNVA